MTLTRRKERLLRSLARRKLRRRRGLFLVEGRRIVAEALRAGWPLRHLFYAPEREAELAEVLAAARAQGLEPLPVPESMLAAVSEVVTPQGILAVAHLRPAGLEEVLARPGPILVAAGVQDPGNLGTLLRVADAYALGGVVLLAGTTDPFAPKAVRASMGALFRLPVAAGVSWPALARHLEAGGRPLLASVPRGGEEPGRPVGRDFALAVGGEGAGLPAGVLAAAVARLTIPTPGPAESLNVAVAAAVLLDRLHRLSPWVA